MIYNIPKAEWPETPDPKDLVSQFTRGGVEADDYRSLMAAFNMGRSDIDVYDMKSSVVMGLYSNMSIKHDVNITMKELGLGIAMRPIRRQDDDQFHGARAYIIDLDTASWKGLSPQNICVETFWKNSMTPFKDNERYQMSPSDDRKYLDQIIFAFREIPINTTTGIALAVRIRNYVECRNPATVDTRWFGRIHLSMMVPEADNPTWRHYDLDDLARDLPGLKIDLSEEFPISESEQALILSLVNRR